MSLDQSTHKIAGSKTLWRVLINFCHHGNSCKNSLSNVPKFLPATFNVNVTTVDGCQLSDSIVVDRIYCELQKGISPNNDNKNDFFDLRLMNVQKLGIYNRLGTNIQYDRKMFYW